MLLYVTVHFDRSLAIGKNENCHKLNAFSPFENEPAISLLPFIHYIKTN